MGSKVAHKEPKAKQSGLGSLPALFGTKMWPPCAGPTNRKCVPWSTICVELVLRTQHGQPLNIYIAILASWTNFAQVTVGHLFAQMRSEQRLDFSLKLFAVGLL